MSNECIIEEYGAFDSNFQIPTQPLTTQIVDVGNSFAALNPQTKYIRVKSKGVAFWYSFSTAIANTAGSIYIPADGFFDHKITSNVTTIVDTAADA